jgi:hypothetical protein
MMTRDDTLENSSWKRNNIEENENQTDNSLSKTKIYSNPFKFLNFMISLIEETVN